MTDPSQYPQALRDRYRERPLYVLVENFVLHAIGALPQDTYDGLAALEPRFARIFGQDGSWIEIVKRTLQIPPEFEEDVRHLWQRNVDLFRQHNQRADPIEFARAVADEHFPFSTTD